MQMNYVPNSDCEQGRISSENVYIYGTQETSIGAKYPIEIYVIFKNRQLVLTQEVDPQPASKTLKLNKVLIRSFYPNGSLLVG